MNLPTNSRRNVGYFKNVPEPSSFLLAAVGALLLWPLLKRRRPESGSSPRSSS